LDQNIKGVQSTSSAGSKTHVKNIVSVGMEDKLKAILEVVQEETENSYKNRVQGLSGNNMVDSEDDLPSK
jgi:hypothetical protein